AGASSYRRTGVHPDQVRGRLSPEYALPRLGDDALERAHEALLLPGPDDTVELLLVLARAAGELGEQAAAGGREREPIGAWVGAGAPADHQAAPRKVVEHRREARLVAAVGAAERGLADAGVAADQHQGGEAARPRADFLGEPRERLERRRLR